jgi:hypothetical protein
MAAAFVSNGPATNADFRISRSEAGVQYQPDGRLSTFPKNTATFAGKLLIVPHLARYACQKLSSVAFLSSPTQPRANNKIGVGLSKPVLVSIFRAEEFPGRTLDL